MKIIEIAMLDNGAHNNQNGNLSSVPEGWAVIPDDMVTENFPFGEVAVKTINGVPTVIKWIPLPMPEPEPEPIEPKPVMEVVNYDELAKAIQEGVNEV